MRASTIRRHAAIAAQISGAIVAGDSQLTIAIDDPDLLTRCRDFTTEAAGRQQDSIAQLDGWDIYLWDLDANDDRGPVRISLVWVHGRKASKPAPEGDASEADDLAPIVDLSARRSQRIGQRLAEQYSTAQIITAIRARGGFCPKCRLKIQAHSDEKLIACYGGEHRCGACHEPWAAHTPGEVRAHVELIAQLGNHPQPPHGA